jgi:hypothetical protein
LRPHLGQRRRVGQFLIADPVHPAGVRLHRAARVDQGVQQHLAGRRVEDGDFDDVAAASLGL